MYTSFVRGKRLTKKKKSDYVLIAVPFPPGVTGDRRPPTVNQIFPLPPGFELDSVRIDLTYPTGGVTTVAVNSFRTS